MFSCEISEIFKNTSSGCFCMLAKQEFKKVI